MTDERNNREIKSVTQLARERAAKDYHSKKEKAQVQKEWVEIVKRIPNENGKVILKKLTASGYEYSYYIGKESQCQEYLAKMQKEGKYTPYRSR